MKEFIKKARLKEVVILLGAIAVFVAVSLWTHHNADLLQSWVSRAGHEWSIVFYLALTLAAYVFAPVNSVLLVPVSVSLWGPVGAAVINTIGWTTGSILTYTLSRKFGRPFALRFVSEEKLQEYEKYVPKKNVFFVLLLLQSILPGDILGYALGIFMRINYVTYSVAALLGNLPFTISIVFTATLPWQWQVAIGLVAIVVTVFGFTKIGQKISGQ